MFINIWKLDFDWDFFDIVGVFDDVEEAIEASEKFLEGAVADGYGKEDVHMDIYEIESNIHIPFGDYAKRVMEVRL